MTTKPQADTKDAMATDEFADLDISEQLNLARAGMPETISELLTKAFRSESSDGRLRAWFQICEQVAMHVCNLFNSYYHGHSDAIVELEKQLRPLFRRKDRLSFGDYIAGIRAYSQHLRGELGVPELEALRDIGMNEELSAAITDLRLAKDGCVSLRLTGHQLNSWVERERKRKPAKAKGKLPVVLSHLVEFRNRHAHANPNASYRTDGQGAASADQAPQHAGADWWHDEPVFVAAVETLVGAATRALLLWPPLTRALTSLEICSVGKGLARPDAAHYQYVVQRRIPQSPTMLPLGNSHIVAGKSLTNGDVVIARKSEQKAEVVYVCDLTAFPKNQTDQSKAKREYRQAYIARLTDDGRVLEDERMELDSMANESDLDGGDVGDLEARVLQRWCAAMTHDDVEGDLSEMPALERWLASDDDPEPATAVVACAAGLANLVEPTIMTCVRNVGAATVGRVQSELGFDAVTTLTLLQRLERRGTLKRLGSAEEEDDGHANAVFQVVDASSAERFGKALQQAGEDVKAGNTVPAWSVELLNLANKLLVEAGQGDHGQDVRLLMEQVAGEDTGEEAGDADDEAFTIKVNDQTFSATRLASLLRRLAEYMDQNGIEPVVPFKVGRTRYLVNHQPQHENGTAMPYPIDAKIGDETLYFEPNWSRAAGLFHIQRFLKACGLVVDGEAAEAAPSEAPEEECSQAAPEDAIVANEEYANGRGLRFTLNGTEYIAAHTKVKEFLGRVLKILVCEDAIDDDELPIECGRVRYLLADAPIHRDDTPFERPVEEGNYYMETSHGFAPATKYATQLLEKFGATDVEPADFRAQLAVRLGDGTHIEGRNTREFVTGIMAALAEQMLLDEETLTLPFNPTATRSFLSEDGMHPAAEGEKPKKMTTPLEISSGSRTFYAEVNLSRPNALDWVLKLLEHLECDVAASGAAAVAAASTNEQDKETRPSTDILGSLADVGGLMLSGATTAGARRLEDVIDKAAEQLSGGLVGDDK